MKTRIITIIAVLLSLTVGRAADRLQIGNITMKPGEVKDIVLSLSQDKEKYAGVQFDLQLPTGLSLGMTGDEIYYSFAGQQANDLTCNVVKVDEDVYRFMVYSNSLQLLKSGELMTLSIKAEDSMALDEYSLLLNNVMLSDIDGDVTKLGNSTSTVKVTDFFNLIYQVDGEEYKSIKVEFGATITPEAAPTKESYVFSGWSEIPETMPANDVTVTGTFTYVPPTAYTLTYIVDGEVYETASYYEGDAITPESEPTKEGYTFSGWSYIPETMPAYDVTITGSFTKGMYKLTYEINSEVYKTVSYDYGSSIDPEPAPIKEGYTFSGWSEIPETMPAEDVTVTGKFTVNKYKLTYQVDDAEYKTIEVEYDTTITPEIAPTKEGYTFSGWSDIPETMPAQDVTVTGTFTINKYKLTYQVDDAEYKTIEVEYGTTITPEVAPTKDGYTFSGWSEIPETMPAHDVTITGSFTKGMYKLTYVVNGEVYKTISYDYGASVTPEPDLMGEGYTFSGWSWIPTKMPAEDVTVTATFTANKYKLIYKVDGEVYKSYDVEYGTSLSTEAEPTNEGYTFSGWSWIPSKMPAEDVTVTGSFTINKYKLTYQVDGKEYKTYEVEYGSTIIPEPQPEGDYVRFAWVGIPEKMPAHDVTVTADFETAIMGVVAKNDIRYIYGPNGKRVHKLQKGVNIVVMNNGTVRKVVMK